MITSRISRPLYVFLCEVTKMCGCENVLHWHTSTNSDCPLERAWWPSLLLMSHHIAETGQWWGEDWEESLVYAVSTELESAGRERMGRSKTGTDGKNESLLNPPPFLSEKATPAFPAAQKLCQKIQSMGRDTL